MPIVRLRNPANPDPLDFVDLEDGGEVAAGFRRLGWVEVVDQLDEPDVNRRWPNPADNPQQEPEERPFELREDPFNRGADGPRLIRPIRLFGAAPLAPWAMSDGKTGEDLFRLILSSIREIYEVDAVIAGGAVRDLAAGATDRSKDVDVFIPMTWDTFSKHVSELGWKENPHLVKKGRYDKKENKTCVVNSTARAAGIVQGSVVDLVFIDKPLDAAGVDFFPVNAQKCVWTLKDGMRVSPAAQHDIDNKTFTISPRITHKDAIKAVRNKINEWKKRAVYSGWKVVEPDIKEWWEKENEAPKSVQKTKSGRIKAFWDL
jgi:hypothetical protein